MDRDSIIRSYLEKITALEATRRNSLRSDDLHELARSLGMSEDDLAAAEAARRAHVDRGVNHARYKQWDDAITELKEALAYDPMDVETLHSLALAHQGRWTQRGNQDDRQQARSLARRLLEIDPRHEASFALLGELDLPASTADLKQKRALRFFIPLLLLIPLCLALIFALDSSPEPAPPEPLTDAQRQQQPLPEFAVVEQPVESGTGGNATVEIQPTALSTGITFTPTDFTSQKSVYGLDGWINSDRPLAGIELKCELLDFKGDLIRSKEVEIRSSGGEATVLPLRLRVDGVEQGVRSVRIWVTRVSDR